MFYLLNSGVTTVSVCLCIRTVAIAGTRSNSTTLPANSRLSANLTNFPACLFLLAFTQPELQMLQKQHIIVMCNVMWSVQKNRPGNVVEKTQLERENSLILVW